MIAKVIASIAAVGALQIAAVSPSATSAVPAVAGRADSSAMQLRLGMRRLWSDHVIWLRGYIIAALAAQPDQQAAANRLMKNQEDIGNAIAGYYGKAAGDSLTTLLKTHIARAMDLVTAAKAGDTAAQNKADTVWRANAKDIADFLSRANPNWPQKTLNDMMNMHLATTTNEVMARLNKRWDEDVVAFDAGYTHILNMSDTLSNGIIKQFPEKFRPTISTRP